MLARAVTLNPFWVVYPKYMMKSYREPQKCAYFACFLENNIIFQWLALLLELVQNYVDELNWYSVQIWNQRAKTYLNWPVIEITADWNLSQVPSVISQSTTRGTHVLGWGSLRDYKPIHPDTSPFGYQVVDTPVRPEDNNIGFHGNTHKMVLILGKAF